VRLFDQENGMAATLKRSPPTATADQWRGLPSTIRVVFITNRQRTGGWLADALVTENARRVVLEEVAGGAAGLARLRDEAFDAVLVSHEPGELDAVDLVAGYRAGGADEAIVVLGNQSEQEMAASCFEAGADAYVCAHTTTTRNLLWVVSRAVQRHQLARENRRLNLADRQRLQRERDEAERLLVQQRALISDLEAIQQQSSLRSGKAGPAPNDGRTTCAGVSTPKCAPDSAPAGLPKELVQHYRELLRTYVIMGSGNLACEMSRLADLLTTSGVSARQTMQLHLHVLEELVGGLGARSTRHVMTRADLLALEMMIHLAEGYRDRYQERVRPPSQRVLPGFGLAVQT
jgi:DNA-binding response OmpR family regulator